MARTTQKDRDAALHREVALKRALLAALSHRDLLVLARAAEAYAQILKVVDTHHPDPDIRDDAARLPELAQILLEANAARVFLEEGASGG
jgi:hypothetical protein